jgi:hypothetical protein
MKTAKNIVQQRISLMTILMIAAIGLRLTVVNARCRADALIKCASLQKLWLSRVKLSDNLMIVLKNTSKALVNYSKSAYDKSKKRL